MLSRHHGIGCPHVWEAQRAWLLTLSVLDDFSPNEENRLKHRLLQAEEALLTMSYHLSPHERPAFLEECGELGNAAARILYAGMKTLGIT